MSRRDKSTFPPRTRFTFRIGVAGHRPDNLKEAELDLLRARLHKVLGFLKETVSELHEKASELYLDEPPVLRVISPIAEGSDRLVAQVALSLGFELQCPLPFHVEDYEKDFKTDESRAEFYELLGSANAILELDGSRETYNFQNRSYEAAGRMVVEQSDVIITVWDGNKPGKQGGTSQIVDEAQRHGLPLVWINSRQPHPIQIQIKQLEWKPWESGSELLYERIKDLLLPPNGHGDTVRPGLRDAYLSENKRHWTLGFLWRLFRNLIVDARPGKLSIKLPDFLKATEMEWDRATTGSTSLPERVIDQINTKLRNHYSWADQLADYYANVYRSAFVFNYLMSAFAVLFAFLNHSSQNKDLNLVFNSLEFFIILSILLITFLGTRRRWHERWIDYRLLAEQLRQMRFLMMLGRVSLSPNRLPAHASYGDPRDSWMSWHFRGIVREGGMLTARFDSEYLKAVDAFINEGVKGQITYHETNADRFERINHRLHLAGLFLFGTAFLAVCLHFFVHDPGFKFVLTLLTIVGPSFGAALGAIRGQGEFDRVTKRSRAMSSHLKEISTRLDQLTKQPTELLSLSLGDISVTVAKLMIDEVLDWRLVFQERPLELPG